MSTQPDKNGTSYQQFKDDKQSAETIIIVAVIWLFVLGCITVYWPTWCVWTYLAGTALYFVRKLFVIYRAPRA